MNRSKEISPTLSSSHLADEVGNEAVDAMPKIGGKHEALVKWLMGTPSIYIFGGLVKHILNPVVHPEFGDIDLIGLTEEAMELLQREFGYVFREVPGQGRSPRYFLAKSSHWSKTIQLLLMNSHDEAMVFLFNAQYDLDRVGYSDGKNFYDPGLGEEAIQRAIDEKRASLVKAPRDMRLFSPRRPQIEQHHRLKLILKGFSIIE